MSRCRKTRRTRPTGWGWLPLLALAVFACGAPSDSELDSDLDSDLDSGAHATEPRDVLLVSVDTLRADRLGAYGRPDAGTPVMDGLAARGTRFADAMAPTPITLPSHASLLTGLDPLRHRVRHNGLYALSPEVATLAEQLRDAGFRTGAFVGSVVLAERHGLARGFDRYTAPGYKQAPGVLFLGERPAGVVNRDALDWIDSIGDDRFFLFVHYMEPHAPRRPPEPERTRFASDPYQAEIAVTDRLLGELLDGLTARGRLDETLVMLVADHGESRDDHGEISHGVFLYQSTLHVPMIVAGPSVPKGRVEPAPVSLIDVAPTLLEAVGHSFEAGIDGVSLWPVLTGHAAAPERALYAETFLPRFDYGWSELRALRRGAAKYVDAPRPELYRIDEDPGETRNLVAKDPATAATLASELEALVVRAENAGARPHSVELDPEEKTALASLGYLPGPYAEEGRGDLPDPKDRLAEVADLERAALFQYEGQLREAVALLRALVDDNPAFLEARVRLIMLLLTESRHDEALAEIESFDAIARDVPEGEKVAARAHLMIGGMYAEQQRFAEAARELERALVTPQPPEVHVLLAAIHHDLGDREQAIRVLRDLESSDESSDAAREMLRYLEGRGPVPTSLEGPPPQGAAPSSGNR